MSGYGRCPSGASASCGKCCARLTRTARALPTTRAPPARQPRCQGAGATRATLRPPVDSVSCGSVSHIGHSDVLSPLPQSSFTLPALANSALNCEFSLRNATKSSASFSGLRTIPSLRGETPPNPPRTIRGPSTALFCLGAADAEVEAMPHPAAESAASGEVGKRGVSSWGVRPENEPVLV